MDYHGDMNGEMFLKWVEEKLIPNLEEPSLIVMDNASYHSMELEKQPTTCWNKKQIQQWLDKNGIAYDDTMLKNEILSIAKINKKPKKYIIDELLRQNGHEVLRLPPYHCEFNAIEMIWAEAKSYYNKHIGEDGFGDQKVINTWEKALKKCTPEAWAAKIRHTDKIITEWYKRELIIDSVAPLIINTDEDSEDDDDENEDFFDTM